MDESMEKVYKNIRAKSLEITFSSLNDLKFGG